MSNTIGIRKMTQAFIVRKDFCSNSVFKMSRKNGWTRCSPHRENPRRMRCRLWAKFQRQETRSISRAHVPTVNTEKPTSRATCLLCLTIHRYRTATESIMYISPWRLPDVLCLVPSRTSVSAGLAFHIHATRHYSPRFESKTSAVFFFF